MTKSVRGERTIDIYFSTPLEAVAFWKNSNATNGQTKFLNARDCRVTLLLKA